MTEQDGEGGRGYAPDRITDIPVIVSGCLVSFRNLKIPDRYPQVKRDGAYYKL
jgi:hypothetical protein